MDFNALTQSLVTDPWFYLLGIPAILIYGIGKGGLGGAPGILAVPLMALAISPTQAAAILLPILIVMDVVAVRYHFRNADYGVIKRMLPGSLFGIAIAGIYLYVIPIAGLKLSIGVLSLLFCLQYLWQRRQSSPPSDKPNTVKATFWGFLTGFSSTAIHAGGGPASMYLIPLRLEKLSFVATMAVFFAMLNVVKLIPYASLGEFDTTNLMTALVLMPLAPMGVALGVYLLHRVSQSLVYQICYLCLFLSGMKLTIDGVTMLSG